VAVQRGRFESSGAADTATAASESHPVRTPTRLHRYMTEDEAGARAKRLVWMWVMRACLVCGILYSTLAAIFYGWYAGFPGPNTGSARVIADIWSIVAIVCIGALVASFVGRTASRSGHE